MWWKLLENIFYDVKIFKKKKGVLVIMFVEKDPEE